MGYSPVPLFLPTWWQVHKQFCHPSPLFLILKCHSCLQTHSPLRFTSRAKTSSCKTCFICLSTCCHRVKSKYLVPPFLNWKAYLSPRFKLLGIPTRERDSNAWILKTNSKLLPTVDFSHWKAIWIYLNSLTLFSFNFWPSNIFRSYSFVYFVFKYSWYTLLYQFHVYNIRNQHQDLGTRMSTET